MENFSCQDILRHDSPFMKGVYSIFHRSVGLLNTAMMPPVLQPEEPPVPLSVLVLPPPLWDDLLTVKNRHPSVSVSPFYPQLDQLPPFPLYDPACSSLFVSVRVLNTLGPSVGGQLLYCFLLTVCSQMPALWLGVGWWRLPGTPPPSHCPPEQHKEEVSS